ncbi:calpain clp-1 [Eurytemora carolleeae]|uniref:calpain clp-1 n=1 Tax=Eurytemora carolleeae TaxID=1294199 RepID=UPI000C76CA4B|nr:calpain clp-1 [Eurytemora carolleeae]|eukprot:XP_023323290.1 calpain clp-1-like [Eurytemora affinis]
MGCTPSTDRSSSTSTPEPENNNSVKDSNFLPDPKCQVQIRLSPTSSQVDEDGAGRPARVEVKDEAEERLKTGEEGENDLEEEGPGHGMLGVLGTEEIQGFGPDHPFEDPNFPAEPSSLYFSSRNEDELCLYTWVRPKDLVPEPHIFVDGTSRRDVVQGVLGDCWLLSTCAALAKREDLLYRVVDPHQTLYGPEYTGMIRINIWRYGRWVTVIIDDRIPQKNGSYCYARCLDPAEFWVALVEKAYAKIHGSYEAIEGGMPIEAMVDLTGGLAERYELKDSRKHKTLYKYLRKSFSSQAFITCSRKGDWKMSHKADSNGLVQGHAYTITGLYRVHAQDLGRICLLRIRNPWGDKNEWKGAWSDGDELWSKVEEEKKHEMGLHYMNDGEFWMEFFTDFCNQFEEVSICTLGPDFDHDGQVDSAKYVKIIFGEWMTGMTAGGCRNDLNRFATNPQFLLNINQAEQDEDESGAADPKCQVIICLAQEHRRSQRDKKVKMLQIGFCLYRAGEGENRLNPHHFLYNYDCGTSGPYINYREVFGRFELSVGSYIIIPATFEYGVSSNFMIRIYAEKPIDLKELK